MFQSWWPPSDSYLKTYKRLFWFEHIPTSSCSWGWCYCRGPLFWWFIFSDGCSRWILVKICQTSFLHIIFSLSLSFVFLFTFIYWCHHAFTFSISSLDPCDYDCKELFMTTCLMTRVLFHLFFLLLSTNVNIIHKD